MIPARNAEDSYKYGWSNGDARRRGTRPTGAAPYSVDSFYFDLGDSDGASGRPARSFYGAEGAASTEAERVTYDDGYAGNTEPRYEGHSAWFAAGRADKAAGLLKTWTLRKVVVARPVDPAPGPIRPAPTYVPRDGSSDAPLPPVTVNPPPSAASPYGWPPPVQREPVAPWAWQPNFGGFGGSGIVFYGPGYYVDLSRLFQQQRPQPRYY